MKIRTHFTLCLSAILSACVSTELPQLQPDDVPVEWLGPLDSTQRDWPDQDWWRAFDNAELDRYLGRVMQNNLDLEVNRRNLESARIVLRDAQLDLLPTPTVAISNQSAYQWNRSDGETLRDSSESELSLGVSASFSDILARPAIYAGDIATYDSRVAQAAEISLATLSTATSVYFQLLLTRDKIDFTELNVSNAQAILDIAQARVDSGVAVPIDALQQQLSLERERIFLQNLQQQEVALRASLAQLVGESVQRFDLAGQSLDAVAVPSIQAGLPAELLARRPDLVQAEAELRLARADVDLVKTSFFPQVSLSGSANSSSGSVGELFATPDSFINLNLSIAQLLLDNGSRARNTELATLSLENSLSRYRDAVLNAYNEIEVILREVDYLAAQSLVERRNLETAEEAFRIAQLRYEEGVVDFQTVLLAQSSLFQTRSSVLDSKLGQLNVAVALYRALGGGWEIPPRPEH